MIDIFLETGKKTTPEYRFVDDFVGKFLGVDPLEYKIECVDGKDNLQRAVNKFLDNTISGIRNLVVFDADSSTNGGGFGRRKLELLAKMKELNITADLFLFPNNHDDGMFEDLLMHIARKENHRRFFDCFSDYESCLGDDYIHPNLKGKISTYISSMKSLPNKVRRNLGGGDWQFTNKEYWNLDAEYLLPLKEFILNSITK